MRSAQQMKNFVAATLQYVLTCFFSFYTRNLFVHSLGVSYLGITGLMNNVLGMLAIAELGIATCIVYSLYKPLAEKDQNKVHQLIYLFRRLYAYIGLFVLVMGLCIMPFLSTLAPELKEIPHSLWIYLMYLGNAVVPYYFAYNSTLYTATQQEYKLQFVRTTFYVLSMIATIVVLKLWPDYILLTACTMSLGVCGQLVIYVMAHRRWPWLSKKPEGSLPDEELNTIKKNVKAMVFHKIGDYSLNGTANIIVANAVNLAAVGLMLNYSILVSMLNSVIQSFFHAMLAGMGELIAVSDRKRVHAVFEELNFLAFWFFGLAAVGFYFCVDALIGVWLGDGFLLSRWAVMFMAMDVFTRGMRVPPFVIRASGGMYSSDQYASLLQSAVNLGVGIYLAQSYGVAGVTFAMLFSGLCVPCWYRPYATYREYFRLPFRRYCIAYAAYAAVLGGISFVLSYVLGLYEPETPLTLLGYRVLVVLVVFHIFLLLVAPFMWGGRAALARGFGMFNLLVSKIWK